MSTSSPNSFPLPEAAKILGALWRALKLAHVDEGTRHHLRGRRGLKANTRNEAYEDMVRAFADAGYVPLSADKLERDRTIKLLTNGIAIAITRWDQLVGHARALSDSGDVKTTATRYLRVAAVDVAIRAAAFDLLSNVPSPPEALDVRAEPVPTWAREGGVKAMMRRLPKALGTTRARLSPNNRFDELFDGRNRPSITKLGCFAEVVAKFDKKTPASMWLLHHAWMFALNALCNEIATIVGRAALEEIAAAFRRVRHSARQLLAAAEAKAGHRDGPFLSLLADLIVEGARAPDAGPLIDRLVVDEVYRHQAHACLVDLATKGELPQGAEPLINLLADGHTWATDLRACRVDWILCEFSALVARDPIMPDGVPPELLVRMVKLLVDERLHELVNACFEHPAALLWAARTIVQQAFVRGRFGAVAPMVAKFADALRTPQIYLEAGLVHAAAGELDAALQYLEAIDGPETIAAIAAPLIAVVNALTGRHADALAQLEAIENRDRVLDYARGVALRGLGRVEEAVAVFDLMPGNALALEQAAGCCFQLATNTHGKVAASWTTKGNAYAKQAMQLGRPSLGKGRRRSRRQVSG